MYTLLSLKGFVGIVFWANPTFLTINYNVMAEDNKNKSGQGDHAGNVGNQSSQQGEQSNLRQSGGMGNQSGQGGHQQTGGQSDQRSSNQEQGSRREKESGQRI